MFAIVIRAAAAGARAAAGASAWASVSCETPSKSTLPNSFLLCSNLEAPVFFIFVVGGIFLFDLISFNPVLEEQKRESGIETRVSRADSLNLKFSMKDSEVE